MSQQNQPKTTYTLRITEGGGTFRCQATSGTYPRAAFDTNEIEGHQNKSTATDTTPSAATPARSGRQMTRQSTAAGTFRIGVSTAMFRIAV